MGFSEMKKFVFQTDGVKIQIDDNDVWTITDNEGIITEIYRKPDRYFYAGKGYAGESRFCNFESALIFVLQQRQLTEIVS